MSRGSEDVSCAVRCLVTSMLIVACVMPVTFVLAVENTAGVTASRRSYTVTESQRTVLSGADETLPNSDTENAESQDVVISELEAVPMSSNSQSLDVADNGTWQQ